VVEEELSPSLDTTFDLGLSFWGGHEMAALSALIQFDAVDIDAFTGKLAGKRDWIGSDLSFERSACAVLADPGRDLGILALE